MNLHMAASPAWQHPQHGNIPNMATSPAWQHPQHGNIPSMATPHQTTLVVKSGLGFLICTARLLPVACTFSLFSLKLDAEPDMASLF